jgi:hypothetical protein
MKTLLQFPKHIKESAKPSEIAERYSKIKSEKRRRHVEHVIDDHLAAEVPDSEDQRDSHQ